MDINEFVEYLGKIVPPNEDSTNLYVGDSELSAIRRNNLRVYLTQMKAISPEILLIGEAPGQYGCYLTGIPFTCERNIKCNSFFQGQGYHICNPNPKGERSSLVIWSVLENKHNIPLMWNIYPFHPHKHGSLSNRTPNKAEIDLGKTILDELLKLFPNVRMYGIGHKSADKLKIDYILHPSYNGESLCKQQLDDILK